MRPITARRSTKSVYNANYDTILPAGSFTSTAIDPWYGVDSAGEMLKDDTTVIVSIDAELDHDGFTAAQNKNAHWEFPVTIDNTPPQILSSTSDGETLYALNRINGLIFKISETKDGLQTEDVCTMENPA